MHIYNHVLFYLLHMILEFLVFLIFLILILQFQYFFFHCVHQCCIFLLFYLHVKFTFFYIQKKTDFLSFKNPSFYIFKYYFIKYSGCAKYQSIVFTIPSLNIVFGSQPNSSFNFVGSIAYL